MFSPSLINPIATPETGAEIGTPAAIKLIVLEQTEAIEVEPLLSIASDTRRNA